MPGARPVPGLRRGTRGRSVTASSSAPGGGGPLVVIGDTLLDVDLEGSSDRLCPDAPVPVVDLRRRWLRPGGAGLTALLAARAGVPVVLVTGIARDEDGDTLLRLLGAELEVLPQQVHGSTVVKTRVRTTMEPLLRLDTGNGVSGAAPLTSAAVRAITRAGAILRLRLRTGHGRPTRAARPARSWRAARAPGLGPAPARRRRGARRHPDHAERGGGRSGGHRPGRRTGPVPTWCCGARPRPPAV